MSQVPSYNEIFHVSHKAISEIWDEPVEIQEKCDGSQISFMVDEDGELLIRSKGQQLYEDNPGSKMFFEGIQSIKERKPLLVPGYIYRGEYLRVAKHNTIRYSRIPTDHIIIFDIQIAMGEFASPDQRKELAASLGYEVVPTFYNGVWGHDLVDLKEFLELDSVLGGSKIEGVVVKCYTKFYGGKPMMGKLVSDAFKEKNDKEWKKSNPGKKDKVEELIDMYRTEARWRKAIQHLRDSGSLDNSPRDIGPLLKEVATDVKKEEEDAIKDLLFQWAWPQISRGITRGLPDFYKDYLLEGE